MVRIPLMIKFPARDDVAPARIASLVETVDVKPTLLAYVGAPIPPELEGENLLPLIRGETRALANPEVVIATQLRDVHAIRDGDWKFILRVPEGDEELYDLKSDPDEQRNLAAEQPDRAGALRARLAPFVRADAEAIGPDNRLRDDPRMNELLEKLGYVDDRPKDARPK
jgi:arylsulfatase A-like enzyme